MVVDPTAASETPADAWADIDEALADIATLADTAADEAMFYSGALERTVASLAAIAGAVWVRDESNQWTILVQRGNADTLRSLREPAHAQRIAQIATQCAATAMPPSSAENPSAYLLLLQAVTVDNCNLAAIEIAQRPGAGAAAMRGYQRFLSTAAECAVEFHRNALLRQLRGREAWWRSFAEVSARLAGCQDVCRLGFEMANGVRLLLAADRASVVAVRAGRSRMMAVSGVDSFDARSPAVQAAEALAAAVKQIGEPLWYPNDTRVLAPQIDEALARHLDASPAKELAVLPLVPDAAPSNAAVGALLIERFGAPPRGPSEWNDGWQIVTRLCAGMLENALRWESMPLGALTRRFARSRRQSARPVPRTAVAGVALAAVAAVLGLMPADFTVTAPGELQPVRLRDVFSTADGEVVDLAVQYGQRVAKGEVLARLRSPKLELESTRVLGELNTAQARLATLESARLDGRSSTPDSAERAQQMIAEEAELRETVKSLAAQRESLENERRQLELASPIDGTIVTPWEVLDALPSRPVRHGQQLLSVADASGPWRLELHVPDRAIGHVLSARADGAEQRVNYVVLADPGVEHAGTVDDVALRTETDVEGRSSVLVRVRIDRNGLTDPRPGAGVTARVECGRRALGYVWFHQLWDRLSAWWTLHM